MASPNVRKFLSLSWWSMNLLLLLPLLLLFGCTLMTCANGTTINSTTITSSSDSSQLSSTTLQTTKNGSSYGSSVEQIPQAEALRTSSSRSLSTENLSLNNSSTAVEISQRQQLSNRLLVMLKLLQLIQQYSTVNDSSLISDDEQSGVQNGTVSESRSVTSWLRFRRPQRTQQESSTAQSSHSGFSLLSKFASSGSHHLPQTSPQQRHSSHHNPFTPSSSSFSSSKVPHNSHNSLFYSLDDANGIDYWLKFLEEANFEERLPPLSGGQLAGGGGNGAFQMQSGLPKLKEKTLLKMKPMSNSGMSLNSSPFKRVKANRYRTKSGQHGRNHNHHHHNHNHHSQRHSSDGHRKTNKGHHHRPHYTLGSIEPLRNLHSESADFESDNGNGNNDLSHLMLTDSKPTDSTKQVTKQSSSSETYAADTSPRCDKFTDEICIDDFEYPENAILEEIFQRKDIFQLMYSEVKGDAPLVDGIPRDEEESFSQDYYYNNNSDPEGTDDYDGGGGTSNRTEYNSNNNGDFQDDSLADEQPLPLSKQQLQQQQTEGVHSEKKNRANSGGGGSGSASAASGFVCRSEVLYAKPKLARNIKGKWKVIVNAGEFTQTIRLEKCTRPNAECRFIADHKYDSRCAQISAIHRLLVFEKGKGFYIDTFRVPTACTCHVMSSKSAYNAGETGASSSSSISKRDKIKSNLGETLWSLLGTEPEKGKGGDRRGGATHYVFNDHRSKNGVDLLKLLPQLTSVAPENVLQQLLDEYTDNQGSQRHGSSSNNKGYGNRVSAGTRTRYLSKIPKSELQQLLQFAQAQNSGTVLTGDNVGSSEQHIHSSGSGQHKRNRISEKSGAASYLQHSSNPSTTTTTIVNSNGGPGGAPMVQVIHVPVTASETVGPDDSSSSSVEDTRQSSRNRFRPILHPMHAIITGGGGRGTHPKHSPKYLITTSSNYLQSQSQRITNSSIAPPPLGQSTTTEQQLKAADLEQSNSNSEAKRKATEKRVNFSYHPILDYIAT